MTTAHDRVARNPAELWRCREAAPRDALLGITLAEALIIGPGAEVVECALPPLPPPHLFGQVVIVTDLPPGYTLRATPTEDTTA